MGGRRRGGRVRGTGGGDDNCKRCDEDESIGLSVMCLCTGFNMICTHRYHVSILYTFIPTNQPTNYTFSSPLSNSVSISLPSFFPSYALSLVQYYLVFLVSMSIYITYSSFQKGTMGVSAVRVCVCVYVRRNCLYSIV